MIAFLKSKTQKINHWLIVRPTGYEATVYSVVRSVKVMNSNRNQSQRALKDLVFLKGEVVERTIKLYEGNVWFLLVYKIVIANLNRYQPLLLFLSTSIGIHSHLLIVYTPFLNYSFNLTIEKIYHQT
jgi:hypothetical protein